jgi:hypothetical protein
MNRFGFRTGSSIAAWAIVISCTFARNAAPAENVDPLNDGSRFAYSENTGWMNAEPLGDGGPGVQVSDFALTGYMWSENVGWISLSCLNTSSCGTVSYGVTNDTAGDLSGYAWSENAGWISFSCRTTSSCATASYGVVIDHATGDFSGRAWGENIGWVTFASGGAVPYKVKTGWTCAAPSGSPLLTLAPAGGGNTLLSWNLPSAVTFDVLYGSLNTLKSTGGDFSSAVTSCLLDDATQTTTLFESVPPVGEAFFFLTRGANCGGGTWDTGAPSQAGSRDQGIAASRNRCP